MEKNNIPLEHLDGTVERIIYYNKDNGFTIMEISTDDGSVIIKGITGGVAEGEEISAEGHHVSHHKYGQQFQAEMVQRTLPTTASAILKYLSSKAIKGIGPATAKKMVAVFGDKTLEILEREPHRLAEVKGISVEKAKVLGDEFAQSFGARKIMLSLTEYGLAPSVAIKAWKKWRLSALELVQENPYILCCESVGVDFETIDDIALNKLKIPPESHKRICAGVRHILRYNSRQGGHTCVPPKFLLQAVKDFLEIPQDPALETISEMEKDSELVTYRVDGEDWIYLPEFYAAEATIAGHISLMRQLISPQARDWEAETNRLERSFGITYGRQQRQAIQAAMENPIFILTGGPGTGKTTTLNGILTLLEESGLKVALAAPTGRAAKRMTEVTGREAKTLHRLLEVKPYQETLTFRHNEKNPIPADAIIVDEMSMVDTLILEALFRGIRLGCKLILVGDSDQLPSVSAGQVLGDLIASSCVPTVHLDEVFRQAEKSLIVVNAHAIVEGKIPQLDKKDQDFFFLQRKEASQVQALVADLCARRLPSSYGFRPLWDIQVITPMKQGPLGTRELNVILQKHLNPPSALKKEVVFQERTFREGDKVMQIQNNYDLPWKSDDGQDGEGVFNGDIGIVEAIEPSSKSILVRFDSIVASYTFDTINQLEHAYAITVHKSQGSEFEAVVMPLMGNHRNLYYRSLLYTGVTRARRLLVMSGEQEAVARMVRNDRRAKRYTNLRSMLNDVS